MTDADHVQAFLVADEVLRSRYHGKRLGGLFGFAILVDERMPKGIAVLGEQEGAIVTHDFDPWRRLLKPPTGLAQ